MDIYVELPSDLQKIVDRSLHEMRMQSVMLHISCGWEWVVIEEEREICYSKWCNLRNVSDFGSFWDLDTKQIYEQREKYKRLRGIHNMIELKHQLRDICEVAQIQDMYDVTYSRQDSCEIDEQNKRLHNLFEMAKQNKLKAIPMTHCSAYMSSLLRARTH